jgi:nucleoside-diphosphate-sugar epimerase
LRKVLVTGANGFVGTALCLALTGRNIPLRRALRRAGSAHAGGEDVVVGDLGPGTDWSAALDGVDAVVHLAARAHVMRDAAADPLALYRHINVAGTARLARAAVEAGVRRLVFLSSIKVNGEQTADKPYTESDSPRPQDEYGRSKWEAEQALHANAAGSALQTVVLRPPLLYGPGVKGNFLNLMRAIDRGMPLPLGSIRNRRSLLYVSNLADAIILCLEHPAAAGNTYVVADDDGVSTPDLIRAIAAALGRPARLIPFPPSLLELAGAMTGKANAAARLLGSLQVDSNRIRRELGWQPRATLTQGLAATARWYHHA